MNNKPDLYGVMGNPVAHSRSPFIHQEFAKQVKHSLVYEKILVPLDGFPQAVNDFTARGGKGLNITLPFKQQAWQLVHEKSQAAQLAGAVNTITISETQQLIGDNTDGIGIVRDLTKNYQVPLTNKVILLLGAGGAARGCLLPLLNQKPELLVISNRTQEKAELLAQEFSHCGNILCVELEKLNNYTFDLIINSTSASLQGSLPAIPSDIITSKTYCYDMVYSQTITSFLAYAKQHGATTLMDGLGMLVEQAAESFFLWRGLKPETEPVIASLRRMIATS